MKTILFLLALTGLTHAQESDERIMLVPWSKAPKEAPLFFSATAEVNATVKLEEVTSEQHIKFRVHQGKAETLTLPLNGRGDVTGVSGPALRDWAVRISENGERFLDVRPPLVDGKLPAEFEVVVKTRLEIKEDSAMLVLPGPGETTGFSLTVSMTADHGVEMKVIQADRLSPVKTGNGWKYVGSEMAEVSMVVTPAGADARGLALLNSELSGNVSADGNSTSFRLTGVARSQGWGSAVELLGGGAALAAGVSGEGWHVALRKKDKGWVYDLVAERGGEILVDMSFEVPVSRKGDWRMLSFNLPAGVVVPVMIDGMGTDVEFDGNLAVVPALDGNRWRGFLPANGRAHGRQSGRWHAVFLQHGNHRRPGG
jgi:hypothetical protein